MEIKQVKLGNGGFGIDVWSGSDDNPHHWEHHHFQGVTRTGAPDKVWSGEILAVSVSGRPSQPLEETIQLQAARDFMAS